MASPHHTSRPFKLLPGDEATLPPTRTLPAAAPSAAMLEAASWPSACSACCMMAVKDWRKVSSLLGGTDATLGLASAGGWPGGGRRGPKLGPQPGGQLRVLQGSRALQAALPARLYAAAADEPSSPDSGCHHMAEARASLLDACLEADGRIASVKWFTLVVAHRGPSLLCAPLPSSNSKEQTPRSRYGSKSRALPHCCCWIV